MNIQFCYILYLYTCLYMGFSVIASTALLDIYTLLMLTRKVSDWHFEFYVFLLAHRDIKKYEDQY